MRERRCWCLAFIRGELFTWGILPPIRLSGGSRFGRIPSMEWRLLLLRRLLYRHFCHKLIIGAIHLPAHSASLFSLFLLTSSAWIAAVTIVTVNQETFPWLQPGKYATYTSSNAGSPPEYFLQNGTFLVGYGLGCPCSAIARLSWIVAARVGYLVSIDLNYSISGKEHTPQSSTLIPFNYSISNPMKVDIQTGMVTIGGTREGILGLWSQPLPSSNESLFFGSVSIDGAVQNVSGKAQGPVNTFIGPIMINGSTFAQKLYQYDLQDSYFAAPLTGQFHGVNYSVVPMSGQKLQPYLPVEPNGFYDYYNGLALVFSIPEYPVSRTVCELNGSVTSGCHNVVFSTTLGQSFRTVAGVLELSSTNIDLLPVLSTSVSGPQPASPNLLNWGILVIVALLTVTGAFTSYHYRKHRHGIISRSKRQ